MKARTEVVARVRAERDWAVYLYLTSAAQLTRSKVARSTWNRVLPGDFRSSARTRQEARQAAKVGMIGDLSDSVGFWMRVQVTVYMHVVDVVER